MNGLFRLLKKFLDCLREHISATLHEANDVLISVDANSKKGSPLASLLP